MGIKGGNFLQITGNMGDVFKIWEETWEIWEIWEIWGEWAPCCGTNQS